MLIAFMALGEGAGKIVGQKAEIYPAVRRVGEATSNSPIPRVKIDLIRRQMDFSRHRIVQAKVEHLDNTELPGQYTQWDTSAGLIRLGDRSMSRSTRAIDRICQGGEWYDIGWLGITHAAELDTVLHLFCNDSVLRVEDGAVWRVAELRSRESYIRYHWGKDGSLGGTGQYWEVITPYDHRFAGFLEYRNGEWLFQPYFGDGHGQVKVAVLIGGKVRFDLIGKTPKSVYFATGTFHDL